MALALEHTLTERVANALTFGGYGKTQRTLEALQGVEALLAREDFGWAHLNPTTGRDANDLPTADRRSLVARSRKYFIFDPMCGQAVNLFTSYAIGPGFSIQATDDANGDDTLVDPLAPTPATAEKPPTQPQQDGHSPDKLQAFADNFWEHQDNSEVFSVLGQRKHSDKLSIDGELFFVLFPGEDVTRVRVLADCLEIVDIITNPEDYSEKWYHIRTSRNVYGKTETLLYPDIGLHERVMKGEDLPELTPELLRVYHVPDEYTIATMKDAATGADTGYPYIYHVPLNTVGLRGFPLLTRAMDWAKIQRKFLENRATISESHARYAWRRIVNGPAAMAQQMPQGAQGGSPFGPFQAGQTYPGASFPAGGTLTTNGAVNWEPVNAQSGGQNAYIEARNFTLQFCRAVGIPEHYFADGSMGTRATAGMMEKPVELLFVGYQNVWKAIYSKLFAFAWRAADNEWNAHAVRVDGPKILQESVSATIDALVKLLGVLPEFDIEEFRLMILSAFGLDNPQDLLDKIAARGRQMANQAVEVAKAQAAFDPNEPEPDENDPKTDPKQAIAYHKKKANAMQKVAAIFTRSPQFGQGEVGSALVTRKPTPKQTKIASPGGGARG